MNRSRSKLKKAAIWFAIFIVFTLLVKFVDVQPVGDTGTYIGFGTINLAIFNKLGHNVLMYKITQGCGLVAIAIALCTAIAGIDQLIKRKSLHFVDPGIIALGIYYVIVIFFYVFFIFVAVNYRPVYVNSAELESSYPSSHTMLAITVVAALMRYTNVFKNEAPVAKKVYTVACLLFMGLTVIGRLFSGVHWFTDIVGAVLLSVAIMYTYDPIRDKLQVIHDSKESERLERESK